MLIIVNKLKSLIHSLKQIQPAATTTTSMHSAYMPWQDVRLSVCLSHASIVSKPL